MRDPYVKESFLTAIPQSTDPSQRYPTYLYRPLSLSVLQSLSLSCASLKCSGRIINGLRSGRTTPQNSAFSFQTPVPTLPEWPSQEEPGSGLTVSAPVSDVSAPACTNGVWRLLRPVSVAHNNKPSTMLSSNVQSIDLPMDCTAWRFWTMRQPNDCSTPAPNLVRPSSG